MLSGCGTSYLEVSRMAGYVGANPGKMYVVSIEGKDAGKFRDQLYEALSDDGHFTTEPYGLAPKQTPDSLTNTPSIILSGIHSTREDTKYFTEGQGDDKKDYRQRTESHEFQYSIRDAVTGEELDANVMRQDNAGQKEVDKGILSAVVGDAVKGLVEDLVGVESVHRKLLIRDFVATLRLHPEKRVMGLFEEKDIPELKEGVEFARKGNWAAAIERFQAGAESHPNSPLLHKAYFNLGVAFEYNHDFDKALTSLRLADDLAPDQGYAAEIGHCQWFARQYRWQQRYAGSPSGAPR
jgi:tetratricopeptide (TPR) repeat protein